MKIRNLVWLCLIALSLIGCKQNDWLDWKTQNEVWLANELPLLDTAVVTSPTGLKYRVIADPNPTEARPSKTSYVYCDYKLRLINGAQVDAGTGSVFSLSQTVSGFAEGLTKIHCHGDIMIYVPCNLGYGEEAVGTEGTTSYIPPYSTLIFEVHLSDLINY